jgi:lysophospholipase L1-like esterase
MHRSYTRRRFLTLAAGATAACSGGRRCRAAAAPPSDIDPANVVARGSLANSRLLFERNKAGHVAFMGGSITEMQGYRPMVCELLQRRFPATKFTFIDAGISSTCSTTGAFRLATDVLGKGPVDLFFVEFAVNDDQDAGHARRACIRGMEGIVRHARRCNPQMDVLFTYFVNPGMIDAYRAGIIPVSIAAHEAVAERYAISSIHLAREVVRQIDAGELTWKKYGGVHPAPFGNALCTRMIDALMGRQWSGPLQPDAQMAAYPLPRPLDPLSYADGRFIDPREAAIAKGWTMEVPDWKHLPGGKRSRFTRLPMLCAREPGAEASLKFAGTAVGAYIVAGPDAGIVEASVDGGQPQEVNLRHCYSAELHYPRTVMLATDLAPGPHVLRLRISPKSTDSGHAMRIMQFVAN